MRHTILTLAVASALGCTTETLGTIPLLRRGEPDLEPPPTTARVEGEDCLGYLFTQPLSLHHHDLELHRALANALAGTGADALQDATVSLWEGRNNLPGGLVSLFVAERCLMVRGIPVREPRGETPAAGIGARAEPY